MLYNKLSKEEVEEYFLQLEKKWLAELPILFGTPIAGGDTDEYDLEGADDLYEPVTIKLEDSLEEFLIKCILKYNVEYNSIYQQGTEDKYVLQCQYSKNRSIGDLFRIINFYYPGTNILDFILLIVKITLEDKVRHVFCPGIKKNVFFKGRPLYCSQISLIKDQLNITYNCTNLKVCEEINFSDIIAYYFIVTNQNITINELNKN